MHTSKIKCHIYAVQQNIFSNCINIFKLKNNKKTNIFFLNLMRYYIILVLPIYFYIISDIVL